MRGADQRISTVAKKPLWSAARYWLVWEGENVLLFWHRNVSDVLAYFLASTGRMMSGPFLAPIVVEQLMQIQMQVMVGRHLAPRIAFPAIRLK